MPDRVHTEFAEHVHDVLSGRGVQRRGDLVTDEDVRVGREGARDSYALTLAAGELVGNSAR
jgi:hypothetical protein